jgi:hypothetical protein
VAPLVVSVHKGFSGGVVFVRHVAEELEHGYGNHLSRARVAPAEEKQSGAADQLSDDRRVEEPLSRAGGALPKAFDFLLVAIGWRRPVQNVTTHAI